MTEKCKPETYQRRTFEGLAPLTREIQHITRPILGKRGFTGIDILTYWDDIVGADLGKGIQPEKLTFDRNERSNGTLHVKSVGGAFAMLFEHQKERVIERINTFFGYPAVAHIKIRQGALKLAQPTKQVQRDLTPTEKADLLRRVADIDDPELREQTYAVGRALILKQG